MCVCYYYVAMCSGHQGTDFFTYHMTLGSLHTNPVTVAITVTSREEAERLGSALSQQQASTGNSLFGRYNNSPKSVESPAGTAAQTRFQDAEMGELVPPAPTGGSSRMSASGSPAQFNRKASYRDGVTSSEDATTLSRSSPQRERMFEMSSMNKTSASGEPSPADSLRRSASTVSKEDGRRSLITGEQSNTRRSGREDSSMSTAAEALLKRSSTKKK